MARASDRINLTTAELVARWGGRPSEKTVANWRHGEGAGPPFIKYGNRVFYRLVDIEAWEDKHQFASTRGYPERPAAKTIAATPLETAVGNVPQAEELCAAFDAKLTDLRELFEVWVATLTVISPPVRKRGRPKGSRDKGPRQLARGEVRPASQPVKRQTARAT